jgi:predicted anti-sigma-YlaC factor YlaD
MRCHCDMGELVSAVLDGEATDLERAAVRRHLRSCATCRDFNAFSRATRVREREGLGSSPGTSRGVGTPHDLLAARLAAEVRRGRGGRAVWRTTVTLMVVLAFGVTLGALGAQMLGGRGLSEAVPPAYEARLTPSRLLSRDFVRLGEAPPRKRVVPREVASTAEWDEPFVELASLEDYRANPKLVRLAMIP